MTVDPVNDAPVCTAVSLTTNEDTPGSTAPVCNDVDNVSLTYLIGTQPGHGSAAVVSGQLSYSPAPNYHGADSFTYTANDGSLDSVPANVGVTVTPLNDPPYAVRDNVEALLNKPLIIDVLENDGDVDGDALSVTQVTVPAHGTAVIEADNTITYTPAPSYFGSDTFTYTIADPSGATANQDVSIMVILGEANFMNTSTNEFFATLQEAVNDPDTMSWHTILTVGPGPFAGTTLLR